jgi:hypothetical protein
MAEMKACFGHCGGMAIRYRDLSKQHYLYVDDAKMNECNPCPLFAQCMFLTNRNIIKELLRLLDQSGRDLHPRIR